MKDFNAIKRELDAKLEKRDARKRNAFPLHVLHLSQQTMVSALVAFYGFPLDFIASSLIHAAATAIGNARQLRYLWTESPVLFMIFIGSPGSSKSNAIKWAYQPFIQREKQAYKARMKAHGPDGQPSFLKTVTSDATIPSLVEQHDENRRGLCLWVDEIIQLISSARMVTFLLSVFSRIPITLDRKTSKLNIRIEEPDICVIGTIQSAIAAEAFQKGNKHENGALERMLIVKPHEEKRPEWTNKKPDKALETRWDSTVQSLLNLREVRDEEGNLQPESILQFDEEAEEAIRQYRNNESWCERDIDEATKGRILAKMDVYLLRLCIVLHCLNGACEGTDENTITLSTTKAAIDLTEYYKQQAFALWEELSRKNPLDRLSEQKRNIYDALRKRKSFKTSDGLTKAAEHHMPERTFKHWLYSDTKLFRRLGHGTFECLYKSE